MSPNSRLLYELAVPKTNWEAKSRQKRAELQYNNVLVQNEAIKTQQQQAGLAAIQDTMSKLKMLPLESPDKIKVSNLINDKRKELSSYIQENYPDVTSFLKNGSQTWAKKFYEDVISSPQFQNGVKNTEQVAFAKQAIAKGEALLGQETPNGYRRGEEILMDYYKGESGFSFNGSYDPNKVAKEARDYFEKKDNPKGKYSLDASVPQEELSSYFSGIDRLEATDYLYRNKGVKFNYKRYSPEDAQMFGVDLLNKQVSIQQKQKSMELLDAKIDTEKNKAIDGGNQPGSTYFDKSIANYLQVPSAPEIGTVTGKSYVSKDLTLFDMSVGDKTSGKLRLALNSHDISEVSDDILSQNGIKISKIETDGEIDRTSMLSSPSKGVFMGNIARPVDLKGLDVGVLSTDGKLYRPQSFYDIQSNQYRDNKGRKYDDGFMKLKMVIPTSQEEKLIKQIGKENIGMLNRIAPSTKTNGSGNDVTKPGLTSFELLYPVSDITNNEILNRKGTRALQGMKQANEASYSDYTPIFED